MSANQSKGPEKFSNLGRMYREVQELRLQVRQAESAHRLVRNLFDLVAPITFPGMRGNGGATYSMGLM